MTNGVAASEAVLQARPESLRRNRDFRLLITGRAISYVGSQVQMFAMPLLVLAISRSAAIAGIVLALGNLSWLVFGLLAGVLADRWNRKTTMIVSDVCRALLVISVPVAMWLHSLTVAQLCVVAVLSGMFATLFNSADAAALPNVVTPEQLPVAMGYFQSATSTVRIVGSMAAGALYALGRAVPFIADSISFVYSAVSLCFMRVKFTAARDESEGTREKTSLMSDLGAGLGWLIRQRLVRFLMFISTADSIRFGAGYLIIITLAQRVHASAPEIGFVFTGAAVGALVGSLATKRMISRFRLGPIAMVSLWVEALMFPLYAYAPNWLLLAMIAGAESLVAPTYMVALSSYRLAVTPDELRGRTSSTVFTLTTGATSIGALIGGKLIASIGAQHTTLIFAGLLLLLAVLTTANSTVRHSSSVSGAAPSPPASEPEK
jgi:MFS family permease